MAYVQTSQTHRVIARGLKPNVMLLVDKSGSMGTPIRSEPACMGCGVNVRCPANCPTRLSELQAAMDSFLSNPTPVARFGVTFFPSDGQCGGPARVAVPLPAPAANDVDLAPLLASAQAARQQIKALEVSSSNPELNVVGGTPTASSLSFVGTVSGLLDATDKRTDLVLLLTDGAPNCNATNPINCTNVPRPSTELCYAGTCDAPYCHTGYLDRDGTAAAVRKLAEKGLKTVVVGFGADTTSPVAFATLNALAAAGEFGRTCPDGNDGECGAGGRCLQGGVCEKQFYAASNAAELSLALAQISARLVMKPCELELSDLPKDPRLISLLVDGSPVTRGPQTWDYQPGKIVFVGLLCERAKESTPTAPMNVEVRVVNAL